MEDILLLCDREGRASELVSEGLKRDKDGRGEDWRACSLRDNFTCVSQPRAGSCTFQPKQRYQPCHTVLFCRQDTVTFTSHANIIYM